ncbi:MAG: hypothetical protein ACYC5O_15765 [Anaerolineae bacterium]
MAAGSDVIRVRACLAVLDVGRLLLVAHYGTDAGSVQWLIPGGELAPETHAIYGKREGRWFAAADLEGLAYHPQQAVRLALGVG